MIDATASQYLLWVGGAIGVSVIASWSLVRAHATSPHKGSVTRDEFKMLLGQVSEIKEDIKEIRKVIMGA